MSKLARVEGEVITKDGKGHAIEFYEETFIMDDAVKTAAQARSIIKRALITDRLRRKVENYKKVRTCQVIEFTDSKEQPEQTDIDKLLIRCTELNCMPENIENYKRPDYKIKALEKAIQTAEERLKKQKPDQMIDEGEVK